MTICVYGAGSIGCYVGGRLAASGAAVDFVGRERIARQVAGNGLTLTDWRGTEMRAADARIQIAPDAVAGADLVLVAVKSGATAAAGEELAPRIEPGTVVVSLQNGLRNAEVLREKLPGAIVLAGMVGFNVVGRGEGRFHCSTAGELEVQRHRGLDRWSEAFARAGVPLNQRDDIGAVQAGKLLINLENAINALSSLPIKQELSQRAYRRCLALAQREALAAYDAVGLAPAKLTMLPPKWMPTLLGLPDGVFKRAAGRVLEIDPHARSSMWQDLEAGRPTEVDYLNGEVVGLARRHGLAAPVNARLVELVHDAERGGRRDWSGRELLADLAGR
ncbi:2-dehydropantoate 2-reductase [Glycomyces xiaoerkulensis]|uniref:2-dehydropantoate 2-reductase n=1 Tax=Glycomyces xiaoerkulensis TaxID=2038139 RepID=UPI000C264894|nr:2-dehydropantoate 2-reductase [Glycomyces xiaoerkulensis]